MTSFLKMQPDEVNRKMLAEIDSDFSSSVCIHVRHGDNATPKASKHGTLPLSYYHKAIEDLTKTVKSPHFYVFSDDPEWAKENLHLAISLQLMSATTAMKKIMKI